MFLVLGYLFLAVNISLASLNVATGQYYLLPVNAVGVMFSFWIIVQAQWRAR